MQKLLFIFIKQLQYGNLIFHFPMCGNQINQTQVNFSVETIQMR